MSTTAERSVAQPTDSADGSPAHSQRADSSWLDVCRDLGWRGLIAGGLGGGFLYSVESVDRISVLWPSFNSKPEVLTFAAYMAPTVLMCAVVSAAVASMFGLVAGLVGLCEGVGVRWKMPKSTIVGAAIATVLLGIAFRFASLGMPWLVEERIERVANKIDDRLVSIPTVINHFTAFATIGFFALALALVVGAWLWSHRQSRLHRILQAISAFAIASAVLALYAVDSRYYYGRYEFTIHIPATVVQLLGASLALGLLSAAVSKRKNERILRWTALGVLCVATLASCFAFVHLGANQNLKALLWRRSVIARRAFETIAFLSDRDRDGFASVFDGGDLDDANPDINPLATETPGDGLDNNCIGGDAQQNLYAPVVDSTETRNALPVGAAKNFLLVSIDTLRADRMSCYGYDRKTAERLAEWGLKGVVFDRAYSQGTNTGLSFASMQRSSQRGELFEKDGATMFRTLATSGFDTCFINARRDDSWLETKRWRKYRSIILDGIQRIDHTEGDALWDADKVTDRAIEYLSQLDARTQHATWVHYLDPHEPRKKMAPFDFGDTASDKYDTEVAFSDREVGRLLDWMQTTGRLGDTVVVLVADHGEGFQDHGMDLHGNRPYNEQIHVPLMFWAPDVPPSRSTTPVELMDIAPSVLSYFGVPSIPGAEGEDILRRPLRERTIHSETPLNLVEVSFFAFAVTDGDWRYIWDVRGNTVELYNLAEDPRELHNLADALPDQARVMRRRMADWLDTTKSVRALKEL